MSIRLDAPKSSGAPQQPGEVLPLGAKDSAPAAQPGPPEAPSPPLPNAPAPSGTPNPTTADGTKPGKATTVATISSRLLNHFAILEQVEEGQIPRERPLENAKQALRDAEAFLLKHQNDHRVTPLYERLTAIVDRLLHPES
jgi:hypothetical protein